MTSIREIEVETLSGIQKHIILDFGNGECTGMPKEIWEELQAKQSEGGIL